MKIVITYKHTGNDDYLDLIKKSFYSAKSRGYTTVLVTTGEISVQADEVIQIEDERYLMNWILKAQEAFINSSVFTENSVFFSPDALILQDLHKVFEGSFDLGVTERFNFPEYPINNGVIFLKVEAKEKLKSMWAEMRVRCYHYPVQIQEWYGDQKALSDILVIYDDAPFGVKTQRFLCETHNMSPSYKGSLESEIEKIANAFIIHFKGARKGMLESFYRLLYENSCHRCN